MLADGAAEFDDRRVGGVDGVGFEAGAVTEDGDDARDLGARQAEHVRADGEAPDLGDDADERAQPCDVFGAPLGAYVGAVFPDDDVREHQLRRPPRSGCVELLKSLRVEPLREG